MSVDPLGWAPAGFNAGVEIGHREKVVRYGSMAIMALGLYWTVTRLFLSA